MKQHVAAIGLILLLSLWTILPFFSSGFFSMHDDTQVSRVIVMGKALRLGQFPVRWVSDLGYGYGYPIFNFYGPLPYYVGGIFYAAGVDAIFATKIMFAAGILLAGIAMYFLAYALAGSAGGILAALLYMYAPYHAVQIYVRGAVGEFWVLVFLPLIMLGLWYSLFEAKRYAPLIGGMGLTGVILSHTIFGYVTTVFLVVSLIIYWCIRMLRHQADRSSIVSQIYMLMVGLGISAFFWLPAILEMRFTNVAAQIGPSANFRDHFVCIQQLWDSPWGYGGSAPGCIDGLSFKLGKLHIVLSLLSLGIWFLRRKENRHFTFASVGGLLIFFFSFFFMTQISERIWDLIPFFSFIQYPWRFLAFAVFSLSLVASGIMFIGRNYFRWFLLFVFIPLIVFVNGKLFVPQYMYTRLSKAFETEADLKFRVSKISDEYLPPQIERPKTIVDIAHEAISADAGFSVDTEIDTDIYKKFIITTQTVQSLLIHRAYFPGWEYWVNGRKVTPVIEHGFPRITIPAERTVVEIWFRNTPIRSFANAVSIITLITLLFIYGKKTIA